MGYINDSEDFDIAYQHRDYFGARESHLLQRFGGDILPGSRVLDVGMGQGRNALPLARQGHLVTGLDPSETSIAQVREVAEREQLAVAAHQMAFQDYDPSDPFQVVLCFGLLQMLPPSQAASLVERLRCWTAPGGLLFLIAWHVDDPGFAACCEKMERTGLRTFRSHDGERFRTFLGRKEILQFFRGWQVVHHWEGLGPVHSHGDGPEERHGDVELVIRRP